MLFNDICAMKHIFIFRIAYRRLEAKMDELINQIEASLNQNNGVMTYQALLDSIPFEQRRLLPNALKTAKRQGRFRKVLRWNADAKQTDFTVEIGVAEEV
jgi:hypothetical protein